MRHRIILCGLGFGFVTGSACGLEPVGEGPAAGAVSAGDSGSADEPDGTVVPDDTGTTPPPVDTSCTSSNPPCTPQDGWQPVAMRIGEGDGCPAGYESIDDVVEATLVDPPNACTCEMKTDPARCDKQDGYEIVGGQGDFPQCLDLVINTVKVDVKGDASCTSFSNSNSANWTGLRASAIAPQSGTCTPTCSATPNAITTKSAGLCAPSPDCLDGACRGAASRTRTSSLAYCLMRDGDVPECPGDLERHPIGRAPRVECTGATCKNNDTCSGAKLRVYQKENCSPPDGGEIFADGTCHKLSSSPKGVSAFKYSATLTPQLPSMETPPTASVAYDEPKTLCCPKED